MQNSTETKVSRPWPVIIMISTLALVMVAGFILSPRSEEDKLRWLSLLGTTNHGILANPPLEVPQGLLRNSQGAEWQALERPTWKLVVVNRGACAEVCTQMLHLLRQIDVRLNRRAELLDRAWLNFGAAQLNMESLGDAYPGLEVLQADQGQYQNWMAGSNLADQVDALILLINPIDVMQMFYTVEHNGSGLLEDLEHLMKLAH